MPRLFVLERPDFGGVSEEKKIFEFKYKMAAFNSLRYHGYLAGFWRGNLYLF